jgi:ABC-type glycerol-3-phosphate transport system permease component
MFLKIKTALFSEAFLKIVAIFYTTIAVILLLLPFGWLISSALKDNVAIYKMPPEFIPAIPIRQEIDIDYTNVEENEEFDEIVKRDAISLIWGTMYEFRDDNVHKVQVNVHKDGNLIYSISSTNYDIKMGSRKVLRTVSYAPSMVEKKYQELTKWANISEYNSKSKIKIYDKPDTKDINEYINSSYDIKGEIIGTQKIEDPTQFLNNFIAAWKNAGEVDSSVNDLGFGLFIMNSVIVSCAAILAQLIISSMAGYALSKLIHGTLGKIVLLFFLATMMIPFIATLLPMYIIFNQFNLLDSLWGLILPSTSWGFAIYLFKGFFDQLPKELMEAARIDGSKEVNTFVKIVIPLSKSVFGVVALWTFLAVWNDFMWPNIIIQKPSLWTYTVALYKVQNLGSFFPNESMALNLIAVLPTLSVMLIFQKYIQKGIAFSGIKG